ncbi:hypothetical protein N303_00439, partial [Cuculus canorus]
QAVGNEGPVIVKVPFSITDLNNWKVAAGNYSDLLDWAARAFKMTIKTRDLDWKVIEAIMFGGTEREMIKRVARSQMEAQITLGALQETAENSFPSVDPHRNPNADGNRLLLTQYQKWILCGMWNAIPKANNW